MSMASKFLWLCSAIAVMTQSVSADLVVSVQGPNGESELSIEPGDPLELIVVTEGPPDIYFGSFALDVLVSSGGLPVMDYSFGSDFDGGFDFSDVSDPSSLRIEAAMATGRFSEPGDLVSISFDTTQVVIGDHLTFDIRIDRFDLDHCFLHCPVSGPPFTLNIVPEPMTVMLLGVGGMAALRRRRPLKD